MARQTRQWHQWLVVDDCQPTTQIHLEQERIEPRPPWRPGVITLGRNLLAAFPRVTGDAVVCIEDDDWYAPDYLETVHGWLEHAPIVGEGRARYYHVGKRRYRELHNAGHASLAATAWRSHVTSDIRGAIEREQSPFFDLAIWRIVTGGLLALNSFRVIGIKGMPGRAGIGGGHHDLCDERDPDLEKLREWMGDDAEHYREFG